MTSLFRNGDVKKKTREYLHITNCNSSNLCSSFKTQTSNPHKEEEVRKLCSHGRMTEALHLLRTPSAAPFPLNSYVVLLQRCIQNKALPQGKLIHAHINQIGFMENPLLSNTLINMYSKCGSLVEAHRVFNQMPQQQRDACSWTVIISAYNKYGFPCEALALFRQMHLTGTTFPNHFAFSSVVTACAKLGNVQLGMQIHGAIITSGFDRYAYVQSALVDMYAKCGTLEIARHMFDKIPQRDVVLWTAMIAGYAQNGYFDEAVELFGLMPEGNEVSWSAMIAGYAQNGYCVEALELFQQLRQAGMMPQSKTFACILSACAGSMAVEHGMEIHEEVIRVGLHSDVLVANALIDMYAKCERIQDAQKLFDKMLQRDVVSWTCMVVGYVQNGLGEEALKLLQQMLLCGVKPSSKLFASVLPACADMRILDWGREIHEKVIKSGFESEVYVESALADMYAKCGRIQKARSLFDKMKRRDVVSWTAMIAGYAENECEEEEALKLFQQMQASGVQPNSKTFASLLSACANMAALDQVLELHEKIIGKGLQHDLFITNALIDAYAKCGKIERSCRLFDNINGWDVVSWTAMISAYAQHGLREEAVELFRDMKLAGMKPNAKTFASVLPAYSNLAALEQGLEVHEDIIRSGYHSDFFVVNALIDMYAKCGSITKARYLFDNLHKRNVVSWNTMISAYAKHGCGKEALDLFEEMQCSGSSPDHVTLLCVLSACCHAGLVEEGHQYFNCMSECYHITPAIEHYSCMVDLLGRAGRLEEAKEFINKMAIQPDVNVWRCFLAACRIYNNIELGEYAAEHLFQLDPTSAASLFAFLEDACCRWEVNEKVQNVMKVENMCQIRTIVYGNEGSRLCSQHKMCA